MDGEIGNVKRAVIRALQGDFPLVEEPYKELAKEAGLTEEEFLKETQRMREERTIRKMGAVLRHREVGYAANALCAWEVPVERMEEVAQKMCESPAVTHCYDRTAHEEWPYNFYTMLHAQTREECDKIASALGEATGIKNRVMLYSTKEWKKTSMKYFCED